MLASFHELSKKLRGAGCSVRITHRRHYFRIEESIVTATHTPLNRRDAEKNYGFYSHHIVPRGGQTVVSVILPNGKTMEEAADCSINDPYNRAKGRNIAIGRLYKSLMKNQLIEADGQTVRLAQTP